MVNYSSYEIGGGNLGNTVTADYTMQPIAVFANQLVRDYGFSIEVKLSNVLGGTNTLVSADVNVFGR